jgi:dTDP-4-amino-4,6-dideoxygalactose transaminase
MPTESAMGRKINSLLKRYTGHTHIWLTTRGNAAILAAFEAAKSLRPESSTVLIPDQAGWLGFRTIPKKAGLTPIEVRTDMGLIETTSLCRNINNESACLIYQNPAGYFADQHIQEIYSVCKGKCLVITDVSGSIGDSELCDGRYADIMVGSFGEWKTVEVGYGGFISCKDDPVAEHIQRFISSDFEGRYLPKLWAELIGAPLRLEMQYKVHSAILRGLSGYSIPYRERKGTNVIVTYTSENERMSIIDYCEKHKYEYTLCPRYIRVLTDAVSIEVKRLR